MRPREQKIQEEQIGVQRINGTDWPILRQLFRVDNRWQIRTICNGICRGYTNFPTLRQARERF